ncbi:MAG: hypothetical protein JNM43_01530 [Planctomycetaceae bacterium]|nr:hypothetical protein [Planctomycetaceae bacterium]
MRHVLLLALFSVVAGCGGSDGPELADVTGTVTLDGKPLARASIRFVPEAAGGSPSYGSTTEDGEYQLLFSAEKSGAMIGRHRVEIEMLEPEFDQEGKIVGEKPPVLPAKYRNGTELSADVKSGSNTIPFQLSSK